MPPPSRCSVRSVSLAADTNPWVIAVPSAITGAAAILGAYLAARHQLIAQREDRREARAERRRDRREKDLRALQDLVGPVSAAYVRGATARASGRVPPAEVSLEQLTTSSHVYALVARIGDAQLAGLVEEWMQGLVRYATDPTDKGDPEGVRVRAVNDRIGQLLRETDGGT